MAGPARDHLTGHDTAVILGGATAGNELRTELVRDFLDGGLRIGEISGLVSHRYFSACERDKILIQDGVDTEWEHLRWYLAATFGPLEAAESVAGGKGSQHWLDGQFQRRKRPEGAGARSLKKLGLGLCQLADDAMRKTRNGPSTSCPYVGGFKGSAQLLVEPMRL